MRAAPLIGRGAGWAEASLVDGYTPPQLSSLVSGTRLPAPSVKNKLIFNLAHFCGGRHFFSVKMKHVL